MASITQTQQNKLKDSQNKPSKYPKKHPKTKQKKPTLSLDQKQDKIQKLFQFIEQ